MTGLTPNAYAAQRGPYANHAAMPGEGKISTIRPRLRRGR
jgi:hypothetical protein